MGATTTNTTKASLLDRPEPNIWPMLMILILAGVLFVSGIATQVIIWKDTISFNQNLLSFLNSFGTLLLVSGASFSGGGLLGFMFGIPRMITNQNSSDSIISGRAISQNDNLVQISDWLTKIIVGVGLTQLYNIPKSINELGLFLELDLAELPDAPIEFKER